MQLNQEECQPPVRREKSFKDSFIKSRRWEVCETMSGRNIYLGERKESEKLMHTIRRGRQWPWCWMTQMGNKNSKIESPSIILWYLKWHKMQFGVLCAERSPHAPPPCAHWDTAGHQGAGRRRQDKEMLVSAGSPGKWSLYAVLTTPRTQLKQS